MIESLHEETLILNRLIDDLQELALADAGQLTLRRQSTALPELLSRTVAAAKPQATDKGLALRLDLAPNLPMLDLDPDRITQALRNLIANAIAHTPNGGEIIVSAAGEESRIVIRVRDTGEGIAPEHLPFVFERFYRADPSRSRSTGGSGLGLAIAKQWVTAHDGEVSVESEMGKGTTFRIVLPISTV
jgi:signal transduction histidine kinase